MRNPASDTSRSLPPANTVLPPSDEIHAASALSPLPEGFAAFALVREGAAPTNSISQAGTAARSVSTPPAVTRLYRRSTALNSCSAASLASPEFVTRLR